MSRQRVLVTGASGFVGSAVVERLSEQPELYDVVAVARSNRGGDNKTCRFFSGMELGESAGWAEVVHGVDAVIHCAARAHVMNDKSVDPLAEFRRVNVDGALSLANEASKAGVKRFVFVSTVKVNGESTNHRTPFSEADERSPEDPYARSKAEAELRLQDFCAEKGMELVVVRPPLVYGPGVKGNFQSLLKLCKLPVPLPFASMKNKRSMVYVGNLADFLVRCVHAPRASGETFLISDDEVFSLSELLRELRHAQGRAAWLIPVPDFLFRVTGVILGKAAALERLTGALVVDAGKARDVLGWSAPYSVRQGLSATVDDFNQREQSGESL